MQKVDGVYEKACGDCGIKDKFANEPPEIYRCMRCVDLEQESYEQELEQEFFRGCDEGLANL